MTPEQDHLGATAERRASAWEQASIGRVWDALLGGMRNFAVDRAIATRLVAVDHCLPTYLYANRAFLVAAVREALAAGVDQFIDIGPGVSTLGCVHDLAQRYAPRARTVYADADHLTVDLWRTLVLNDPYTAAVAGDLRHPQQILADPAVRNLINFDQPVAVVLGAVLHCLTGEDDPARVVKEIRTALAPGSYLIISHATTPVSLQCRRRMASVLAILEEAGTRLTPRAPDEVLALLDGWELVWPVSPLTYWLELRDPVSVPGVGVLGRLS